MSDHESSRYGEQIAEIYDELYSGFDPACIDLLAELAGPGPALELGIGTGRIALPLHARGVDVQGIDASPAMVARLAAKPGGGEIDVLMSSFARFSTDRRYRLVYIVFNTFFGLPDQDEQVRCFECVAEHLTADGCFLIEAFVPDLGRFTDLQAVRLIDLSAETIRVDVAKLDPVAQWIESRHLLLGPAGMRSYPVKLRYAWPSELDLMARLAHLRLRARWSSWTKDPFDEASTKHISVYERD